MAKKIKFPLEMKDGVQVRTIEELKENFDIEKAMEYLLDGKLQTWLSDRYYIQEAEEVGKLDAYAAETKNKLYTLLDIEKQEEDMENVDVEAIEHRKQKLLKLKQYTDDEAIWDKVEFVAFDQEELADLLDEECKTIYLCGEKFQVPYSIGGVAYIGVNQPEVFVNGVGKIDLKEQGISFDGVKILNENIDTGEELYQLGLSYLRETYDNDFDECEKWEELTDKGQECLKKAAEKGNVDALYQLGLSYLRKHYEIIDFDYDYKEKGLEYIKKAAEKGDTNAMGYYCVSIFRYGEIQEKYNITEGEYVEMLNNSVKLGSGIGTAWKGWLIYKGVLYEKDEEEGKRLMKKSLDDETPIAAWLLFHATDIEEEQRLYLEKGVFLKNSACAYELAYAYLSGKYGIDINKHKAGEYANLFNEFEKFGWPHCLEPSLTMKPEIHILSEIDEEIRKNWGCRR
ncbi:MAG: hypothetical protein SOZ48_06930 [Eubacterium sp.]|nr:hypothetical protein [Eubacterium sp.]